MREEDTVCVGSDGLQYCKICGEAKEAFFPEGGFMGMKKHSRQCACDRKAYEEEQKYFKDKEHRELVSRNTSICFDESRMEEWTFENADMSDTVMHRAKKYVDNWEEMKRNHIGCLFWGPVGTGKSFIAGCIANELLKQFLQRCFYRRFAFIDLNRQFIYCMSFGCPFEIASAGIKEGRQSCYKTTCLVDYGSF